MTHEERRKLIEAPISIRTFGGRSWGGHTVLMDDDEATLHGIRSTRLITLHQHWRHNFEYFRQRDEGES